MEEASRPFPPIVTLLLGGSDVIDPGGPIIVLFAPSECAVFRFFRGAAQQHGANVFARKTGRAATEGEQSQGDAN